MDLHSRHSDKKQLFCFFSIKRQRKATSHLPGKFMQMDGGTGRRGLATEQNLPEETWHIEEED